MNVEEARAVRQPARGVVCDGRIAVEGGIEVIGERQCEGRLNRYERQAESFGQPFITHAELCERHAALLGWIR